MDLSSIKINIQADTEQAEKGLKSLKQKGESLASVGQSLTLGLTVPIMTLGTACLMSASDAGEMESKFNTVFKTLGKEADAWATTYAEAIGRSKYEIKEAISNQADLYQGMGFTSDEAFKLSKQVTELGYDLASFNNVNDAQAVDAMTKALMGETESAKMLGVNLTDTIMETSEFTKATGKAWKSLSMSEKAQVRYKEAVKQSQNAIGDAARTSDSFTNQLKRAKGGLNELAVAIGKQVLPVVEPLIQGFNNLVKSITSFISENERVAQGIVIIGGVLAAIGPVLFIVGKLTALIGGLTFSIVPLLVGIGALGVAFIGLKDGALQQVDLLIYNFTNGLSEMLNKIIEVLPTFLQKGTEILMNLLQGLINAIPSLMSSLSGLIMNMVILLFENLPKFYNMGMEWINNLLDGFIQKLPSLLQSVVEGIIRILNNIRQRLPEFLSSGIEFVKNMVTGFANNIPSMISKVGELISTMINKIFEMLPKLISSGWELLKSLVKGLWDNRGEIFEIGKKLISGLIDSILSIGSSLINIGKTIVDNILSGIKSAWSSLTGWVSSKLSDIPIIGGLFKSVDPTDGVQGGAMISGAFNGLGGGMAQFSRTPLSEMLEMPNRFGAVPSRRTTTARGEEVVKKASEGIKQTQNITINTPKHLSPYEVAQEFKKINKQLALSF